MKKIIIVKSRKIRFFMKIYNSKVGNKIPKEGTDILHYKYAKKLEKIKIIDFSNFFEDFLYKCLIINLNLQILIIFALYHCGAIGLVLKHSLMAAHTH